MDTTRGSGTPTGLPPFAVRPVLAIAGALAALLIALSGRYGFHRDELYFLLAGHHPAWGYTDQPPLTPILARATALLGDGPTALRTPSALLSAATVTLTALTARELGAHRRAQTLAAACCAASGYTLAVGHLLSTSTFDLTAELAVLLTALRLLRTRDPRWWPALGAAVGTTLLNKQLVLPLLAALAAALLREHRHRIHRHRTPPHAPTPTTRTPPGAAWALLGTALALLIAAPTLWWQAIHGLPELKVAHELAAQNGWAGRWLLLPLQALQFSPFLLPVALAGWRALRHDDALRHARPLATAYPVLCAMVIVGGGKPYYPLPLLLVLTAAGCEPVLARTRRSARALARTLAAATAVSALATLPLLPAGALALPNAVDPDQGEQVGWPELTAATATAWHDLPPDRRAHAVLLTSNYGEAGALAHYGPALGLPTPYSGHMSLADWGPPPADATGPVLLVHPAGHPALEAPFTGCRTVARVDNGHGVDNLEQHAAVVLCDPAPRPWNELWPQLRQY
ncbi:ArnT family glycosyltransferase [Kitasatospora sp. NPDC051705]|uniref:ArnT family glycosyltransferase n=1 Tax=Kitasatospora sp. NPDC051705 TaxID=3364057 RepID=UPI0037890537